MDVTNYTFFHKLTELSFVEKIWLYGSRARGDFKERSDIDLAIECPHASVLEWFDLLDIIENADTLLKIDCVRVDELKDDSYFKRNIFRDAKLLFQRTNDQLTIPLLKEEKPHFIRTDDRKEIPRWEQNFSDFGEAIGRLQEAIEAPLDDHRFVMDATIQRFEFCIELYWKIFKNFLEMEERKVLSPRDAVSQAYQMEWIDNETLWLEMLKDRNALSHNYNEHKADEVYARIREYYPEMKAVYEKLKKIYVNKS